MTLSKTAISVVIRNKNEASALREILSILTQVYSGDIQEIIVVDNNSTDNSREIAGEFNCRIVSIDRFSYGRAINTGIEEATSPYVLLLSSHAIPVGQNFFRNSILTITRSENIAGIRYINSFENYKRAFQNGFKVTNPIRFGIVAACCLVNKKVWQQFKFQEDLVFAEDKEWSQRVYNSGFQILDLNETYFYFPQRDSSNLLKRYRNETIAEYKLQNKKFPSEPRIIASFFKKILFTNSKNYFLTVVNDLSILNTKFKIRKALAESQTENSSKNNFKKE